MSRILEIKTMLKQMRVGEPVRFPMEKEGEYLEIERLFSHDDGDGWVLYIKGERIVEKDVNEVVRLIQQYWNPSLKRILEQQFSEMMTIIDLGEY